MTAYWYNLQGYSLQVYRIIKSSCPLNGWTKCLVGGNMTSAQEGIVVTKIQIYTVILQKLVRYKTLFFPFPSLYVVIWPVAIYKSILKQMNQCASSSNQRASILCRFKDGVIQILWLWIPLYVIPETRPPVPWSALRLNAPHSTLTHQQASACWAN